MDYKYVVVLMCCLSPLVAIAQQMEFAEPVLLEKLSSDTEEVNPLLSPDGNKLYFVRGFHKENVGGEFSGMDIWLSEKDASGKWGIPTNKLGSWNNKENNAVVGIRKDQEVIYLLNSYFRNKGVAFSKKINQKWTKPELLPFKWVERDDFVGYYMHPDFNIVLISMNGKNSYGKEDLYVSVKDSLGEWSKPINLGPTINTEGFEMSPFLSKDRTKLYFASNGHGGYGDADIFMSERKYGVWDVWSKPINLGSKVNSPQFDGYFSVSSDSTSYFVSNRSSGQSDIYMTKMLSNNNDNSNNLMLSMIEETKKLLAEINSPNEDYKFNYVSFAKSAEYLTDANKAVLDVWIKSLMNTQVTNKVRLTFDNSSDVSYDQQLLFSKRLNTIYSYLMSQGVSKEQVKVERKGEPLKLSPDLAKTTVVLLIE